MASFFDEYAATLLQHVPVAHQFATQERLRELTEKFSDPLQGPAKGKPKGPGSGEQTSQEWRPGVTGFVDGFNWCEHEQPLLGRIGRELDLSASDIAFLQDGLPGSNSPQATPEEQLARNTALARLSRWANEIWQRRRQAMTPEERAAEAREEERQAKEHAQHVVAKFRRERMEILQARRAGENHPEPDWVQHLDHSMIPPDHPAFAEFSMEIEDWGRHIEKMFPRNSGQKATSSTQPAADGRSAVTPGEASPPPRQTGSPPLAAVPVALLAMVVPLLLAVWGLATSKAMPRIMSSWSVKTPVVGRAPAVERAGEQERGGPAASAAPLTGGQCGDGPQSSDEGWILEQNPRTYPVGRSRIYPKTGTGTSRLHRIAGHLRDRLGANPRFGIGGPGENQLNSLS